MKFLYDKFSREGGFSIVELVVVIAVMGVVTAITVPSYISYNPHAQLKIASREIYIALQSARIKAVGSKAEYGIRFNLGAVPPTYRILTRLTSTATWGDDVRSTDVPVGKSVTIDNVIVGATGYTTGVTAVLGFTPLGASTGGTVRLRAGSANDKYSVDVSSSTGRVKIKAGW